MKSFLHMLERYSFSVKTYSIVFAALCLFQQPLIFAYQDGESSEGVPKRRHQVSDEKMSEAEVLMDNGKYAEAFVIYNQIGPDDRYYLPIWLNLSWMCATCPEEKLMNAKDAQRFFQAVEVLDEKYYHFFDLPDHAWNKYAVMAAISAAEADFDKAISLQEKALSLTDKMTMKKRKERVSKGLRAVMELYKNKMRLKTNRISIGRISDEWVERVLEKGELPELAY